jgi:hypothetical protein
MKGRITARQLPLAERSFPGIGSYYRGLSSKPATFLQLVWAFEAQKAARCAARSQIRPRPSR